MRTRIMVRLNLAAARMIDTPCATRALRRSFSSSVQTAFFPRGIGLTTLFLVIEFFNLPLELPQFNIVAVNERLDLLDCGFVVIANQSNCLKEMAVRTDNVSAIFRHGALLGQAGAQHSQSPRVGDAHAYTSVARISLSTSIHSAKPEQKNGSTRAKTPKVSARMPDYSRFR